jgi:FkbM family methyltransferase
VASFAENVIHRLDVAVRRKSQFGQHAWLRKILLRPYRKLINFHGHGVLMNIGGCIPARMPSEYAWKSLEEHEPETMAAMKAWLEKAQNPVVVDAGCALGFFSCAALFANEKSRVIAIDSDMASLRVTRQFCSYARDVEERLSFVCGFLTNEATEAGDYGSAGRAALALMNQETEPGAEMATRYVCLDSKEDAAKPIARHTLDCLLPPGALADSSILIKCDIEGAEWLALNGAKRVLAERRPALLLSVHPWALPNYGTTKEALESFLTNQGYSVRLLAIDHEEHWWCVAR